MTQDFPYNPHVLPPLFNTFSKAVFDVKKFEAVINVSIKVLPEATAAATVIDLDTHNYTAYVD